VSAGARRGGIPGGPSGGSQFGCRDTIAVEATTAITFLILGEWTGRGCLTSAVHLGGVAGGGSAGVLVPNAPRGDSSTKAAL
jgi:hypothetical protein